jgi:uncharacterized protein (DUF1778 family)
MERFRKSRRASQLWYTPEQYDLVKKAANIVRRPMTTFAILATLKAARYTLMNPKDPSSLDRLTGPLTDDQET